MKRIGMLLSLLLAFGLAMAIQPAEDWNAGTPGKYAPTANANYTTEGGNVTPLNLTGNVSTEKWAGYWGNVTGRIVLTPGTSLFYTWAWDSSAGGEVCAVTDAGDFDWTSLGTPTAATVDTIFGFATGDSDDVGTTLPNSCNLDIAGQTPTGIGNFTGAGGFETCAVADGDDTTKSDFAFCVNITQNGNLFNGQTGDYELLVPTNETAGADETHYFWLELD